jgi:hypothetical protein
MQVYHIHILSGMQSTYTTAASTRTIITAKAIGHLGPTAREILYCATKMALHVYATTVSQFTHVIIGEKMYTASLYNLFKGNFAPRAAASQPSIYAHAAEA